MSDREDLESYLQTLAPAVGRACSIVTPNDILGGRLFHISTNTNIRKFVPMIGWRQYKDEDRTVPRVCTAPTLLGCLIGFGAAEELFRSNRSTGEEVDSYYKGGFKIYGFDFKHALKPGKKQIFEQPISDEHWLVAYNKDTAEYVPINFGKLFYHSISSHARSGHKPYDTVEIYVDVQHEDGIRWCIDKVLTKGYWRIRGPEMHLIASWKDSDAYVIEQVNRGEYLQLKELSASLLSAPIDVPSYIKWE